MTLVAVALSLVVTATAATGPWIDGCAAQVYAPARFRRAVRAEFGAAAPSVRSDRPDLARWVHISLPDCEAPDRVTVSYAPPAGPPRQAEVDLRDVPRSFVYRTLALVALDLSTQTSSAPPSTSGARSPEARRSVWSLGPRVGSIIRPAGGLDGAVALLPFIGLATDWRGASAFGGALDVVYERGYADTHVQHGLRASMGPSWSTAGRYEVDLGAGYFVGAVWMRGRGASASAAPPPAVVHGPVARVEVRRPLGSTWDLRVRADAGYEWGAEGRQWERSLFSTHGFFGRLALGFGLRL